MALTHALSTNNYGVAKFIVATSAANGTHTTLASAMADAVAGDTIFLRDSVTENVTITPGVNIASWSGSEENTPSITGKLTMTGAGTSTISGITLITNNDFFLAVTGSAASIVYVVDSTLKCTNNDGISFTSSNAGAVVIIFESQGEITTTGITFFVSSTAGTLYFNRCRLGNSGLTSTNSTSSAGNLYFTYCRVGFPVTTSGTCGMLADYTRFDTGQNITALTVGGSGTTQAKFCDFISGSASSISVGNSLYLSFSNITSSNTNVITGAGTLTYAALSFPGSSSTINTTTQTIGVEGPSKTIGSSKDGGTNSLIVTNSSNTASSDCNVRLIGGGTSSGDQFIQYQVSSSGTSPWAHGIDNSDNDRFVLSSNTSLGTNNAITVTTTGEINYPRQPAFLAFSTLQSNVTGDGTVYTVTFATEIFDQNADFASPTFTAPVTGRYELETALGLLGLTTSHTSGDISITTSNRTYSVFNGNFGAFKNAAANALNGGGAALCDMDAADTAVVSLTVLAGTIVVDVATTSYFSGNLEC